jgi:RNA polymerase sigma-70 factor (ECF subfamily)
VWLSPSWECLYAEHAEALLRYLIKLTGDREVASELMQETFVRGIRGADTERIVSMRAWLFRVATNLGRDHHRRARLLRFVPFSGREESETRFGDADGELVHQALRALPFGQSSALLLRYEGGFTRAEIADLSGVTEEAVKSRLARGRDAFLRRYAELGGQR